MKNRCSNSRYKRTKAIIKGRYSTIIVFQIFIKYFSMYAMTPFKLTPRLASLDAMLILKTL